MPSDLDELFERLDPPPGGAAGLRRRLRSEPRRRRTRALAVALAGVVAIGGLSVALYRHPGQSGQPQVGDPDPARLARGLEDAFPEPAVVPADMRHRVALLRVPLETDQVILYYVAALPEEPSGASNAGTEQGGAPDQP